MSGEYYLILAYVVGLGLLWGYAGWLWNTSRHLCRRERDRNEQHNA